MRRDLARPGLLALVTLMAVSCAPSTSPPPTPSRTTPAADVTGAPEAATKAPHESREIGVVVGFVAPRVDVARPTEGFVAVSGGPDSGCGIRTRGGLQCWGDGPVPLAGEFAAVGVGPRSCGLRVDGSMSCWGLRAPTMAIDEGVVWPPLGEFAALSAGGPVCGLRLDGSLACSIAAWGLPEFLLSPAERALRVPAPGGAFVAVSVNSFHGCGIRPSFALECWGNNLALDRRGHRIVSVVDAGAARPPAGEFVAVSAGREHTCAIAVDGALVCWGSNLDNQLAAIPEGAFAAVTAAAESTCALRSDGTAVCWGGPGGRVAGSTPEGRFVAISEDDGGFCGVRPDGNIECWRIRESWKWCLWRAMSYSPFEGISCASADGILVYSHGAVRALPPPGEYAALSARKGYTCGLLVGGEARCWGLFFDAEANPPRGPFREISAGWFHACGLRPDGTAACWGNDDAWAQPPPGRFSAISAGWEYTCALRPDGAPTCWGRPPGCAAWGLIGRTGDSTNWPFECWDRADSPTVDPPEGNYTAIAASAAHACALSASDRAAVCWGDNRFGQTDAPPGPFTALSAGFAHTCGLRLAGDAECWGNNDVAQAAAPPGPFTTITAGEWHTCGLRPDGSAACWGHHATETIRSQGILTPWDEGDMAWIDARSSPPPGPYTALAAGNFGTCAIRTDRSVDCWGHGS